MSTEKSKNVVVTKKARENLVKARAGAITLPVSNMRICFHHCYLSFFSLRRPVQPRACASALSI